MQEFTGIQYLEIDIANKFGMDKELWEDRLKWTTDNKSKLESLVSGADEPFMFIKAIKAYEDAKLGQPIGHIMFLDSTASGLQMMAAMSGCKKTAMAVNMIDPNSRRDVYTDAVKEMNKYLVTTEQVNRALIKIPLMSHYYNKWKQETLSDAQLIVFRSVLTDSFQGAEDIKRISTEQWNPNALYHRWSLPDGYIAKVLVTDTVTKSIEVDELDHARFNYRSEMNMCKDANTSLSAISHIQ